MSPTWQSVYIGAPGREAGEGGRVAMAGRPGAVAKAKGIFFYKIDFFRLALLHNVKCTSFIFK